MAKQNCKDCEQAITKICRACREDMELYEVCSRCEEKKHVNEFNNEDGEIPYCIDCEGVCRTCGTTEYEEEELEHGLCDSCCKDLDEAAEEEE